jgi:hypothetical protein
VVDRQNELRRSLPQLREPHSSAIASDSFRNSVQNALIAQRSAFGFDTARALQSSLQSALGGSIARESSWSRQLAAAAFHAQRAIATSSLERALTSAQFTHSAIESSLASQLEKSARAQQALLRNPAFERSLKNALDSQTALRASLADKLQRSLAGQTEALMGSTISGFQNTARQHEEIARSLRSLNSFGDRALSTLIAGRNSTVSNSLGFVGAGISAALGSWGPAIGTGFSKDLETSLVNQVADDPEVSIVAAVTQAVGQAIESNHTRTDWRFVVSLIVSLLFFLYQNHEAAQDQNILRHSVEAIQERLLSQERVLELLLTKEVDRSTPLYARPTSRSKVLGRLDRGTVVIVLSRRNKWTKVGLRLDRSGSSTSTGWLLNKYLKK